MRFVIVPGGGGSEPAHWQSIWEQELAGRATRIRPRSWTDPDPEDWLAEITAAATPDAVLVTHSLGCLAAAAWCREDRGPRVSGVFLVAVPDPESPAFPPQCAGFRRPAGPLGVPALMVASGDDPYSSMSWSRETAREWGASLVAFDDLGHVNVASGIGRWTAGRDLLTAFCAGLTAPGGPTDGARRAPRPAEDDGWPTAPG